MEENLVIVESPAKAKTIEKFLGKNYLVKSSYGHIRDLSKKNLGIDIQNNFEPQYEISEDKQVVVKELKKLSKDAKCIWLASDEDREGEAIAWHLSEVLELSKEKTKRIVFHEITKEAITNAIKKPRSIDLNLVEAQQARRLLDRIVGFELSPLLWKKVKPSLSAGRVQSVAVRVIVEREREIIAFQSSYSFKVVGTFLIKNKENETVELKAELSTKFATKEEARKFLEICKGADFKVSDIVKKPAKKSPSAPFTTSTLQQEASRKLGFSVSQTMVIAQRLYEEGKITYMRTDSVNLSDLALNLAKTEIISEFGEKYSQTRKYKTKSKGAQEAHEAIRPAYLDKKTITGNDAEKKLYDLIYKRTIASQMSDAELERTQVTIDISNSNHTFQASGEVIKFDGFLRVYSESTDDEKEESPKIIPPLKVNQVLDLDNIKATQKFATHPPRYTEASLVRRLEELGIGRPSTYAPIISTIQQRGYVLKDNRDGIERSYSNLVLKNQKITEETKKEITGQEKSKLFPTDIGMLVNDYLVGKFQSIMDFNFTATVEKSFDEIAEGKMTWSNMLDDFYKKFHPLVEKFMNVNEYADGKRVLGKDPQTGKTILVRIGRFGPIVQIGEATEEGDEKPKYASLRKEQHIETITLEQALELFKLPREIGEYESSKVVASIGRFGPYLLHNKKFYTLKKGVDDPYTIELPRAIEVIDEKRDADKNKIIKEFSEDSGLLILNGRYGPYISYNKLNYKIPKASVPANISFKECMEIIESSPEKKPSRGFSRGKTTNSPKANTYKAKGSSAKPKSETTQKTKTEKPKTSSTKKTSSKTTGTKKAVASKVKKK